MVGVRAIAGASDIGLSDLPSTLTRITSAPWSASTAITWSPTSVVEMPALSVVTTTTFT